jgi:acyl carrier protein
MLKTKDINEIIFQALNSINDERDPNEIIEVHEETCLFGENGVLDSLSLVTAIVDIESAISEASGQDICLTDDKAMNQENSPFSTVQSLTAYIELLLSGAI